MNIYDYILIGIIAMCLILAIKSMISRKKRGKSLGCSGCSDCSACSSCSKKIES